LKNYFPLARGGGAERFRRFEEVEKKNCLPAGKPPPLDTS